MLHKYLVVFSSLLYLSHPKAPMLKTAIQTKRLLLRELTTKDAPGMFLLDSDPLVHQYLGNQPVRDLSQSLSDIEFIKAQYESNGIGRWAVILRQTGEFIGWSGLKLITEPTNGQKNYYDLGYRFIRSAWGKGYAQESALAAIDYGFNILKIDEIIAIADVGNLASIHVLEKVGLEKISLFDYHGRMHHWMKTARK